MLYLTGRDIDSRLNISSAVEVVEAALRDLVIQRSVNLDRQTMNLKNGTFRSMAAYVATSNSVGIKVGFWSSEFRGDVEPARSSETILLYDPLTGELLTLIRSHFLNRVRTAAATAVAIRRLASPNASVLAIFGTGPHADAQVRGCMAVRPIARLYVCSRTSAHAEEFAARFRHDFAIDVRPVGHADNSWLGEAEIVITATSSAVPVFDGDDLRQGALVVSIGSSYEGRRELDDQVYRRAEVVVVDSKEQAVREASGDVLGPIASGAVTWDRMMELGDVLSSTNTGAVPTEHIVIFKCLGMAVYDVAVARMAYNIARAEGLGRELPA